jgi:hypothetical protein
MINQSLQVSWCPSKRIGMADGRFVTWDWGFDNSGPGSYLSQIDYFRDYWKTGGEHRLALRLSTIVVQSQLAFSPILRFCVDLGTNYGASCHNLIFVPCATRVLNSGGA